MNFDLLTKLNYNLIQFDSINSTNLYGLENITSIQDKTIITANIQLNGRGRLERKWISSSEQNLYFSIVLKPEGSVTQLPLANLTQYMSVILCRILVKYNIVPEIKWPNDVLINGKKICGILSEVSFTGNKFNGIVLGTGFNINFFPELAEKPATSLFAETGIKFEKSDFLIDILTDFFNDYTKFISNGFNFIKNEYLSYFPFSGKTITINNGNLITEGKVKDISSDGTLILKLSDGLEIKILAGDIT